jgi:spoIIIJ-associated protein
VGEPPEEVGVKHLAPTEETAVYDPKSEPREFVGADRAEAVEKACRYFEVSQEDLAIAELPEGEIFGLAARSVVVAVPRGAERRAPREERGEERRGREREKRIDERAGRERERRERRPPEELPPGPSEATPIGELGAAGEFVVGLVERMEVGPFEIEESADGEICVIQIRGSAASGLTGGDGRAADAIQLLANQAAMRQSDDPPRIVVDVEGDLERREAYLGDLAQRAARRALKMGRAVALDPMNPKSRRILHVALRKTDDIATMSTGSGRYRQVVVVPKGAPEYEDAVRSSEEATRGED